MFKPKPLSLFAIISLIALFSCTNSPKESPENLDAKEVVDTANVGTTDFLDEILLGYEMRAIPKYMVSTPFKLLGATDIRQNFEFIDENKAVHFVSFSSWEGDELNYFHYGIDFKDNNQNLATGYFQDLQKQLEKIYGLDYETGYNDRGFFEVEWYFEAGVLLLTLGTDFIYVDVNEH